MFSGCESINRINLGYLNTSNLINMSHLFYNCLNLSELDMEEFNTDKVENMDYLLYGCQNLNYINFTSFNTTLVESLNNTKNIFEGLSSESGVFACKADLFSDNIWEQLPKSWKTDENRCK